MPAKRNIMPEEVRNAKLLLSKGLSDAEVASIIGRSVSAVVNIRNGAYDFILEDVPNDTPDDSRVYILLKSIDSRLYRQFTELARSRNAEPEELLLDYIRRTVEEAGKEEA